MTTPVVPVTFFVAACPDHLWTNYLLHQTPADAAAEAALHVHEADGRCSFIEPEEWTGMGPEQIREARRWERRRQ